MVSEVWVLRSKKVKQLQVESDPGLRRARPAGRRLLRCRLAVGNLLRLILSRHARLPRDAIRWRWWWSLVVAAAMLYFGIHMARRSGRQRSGSLGYGTPAPNFTLETLDGKSMSFRGFEGKAVLVNFWATWCGPCKIETPWLVELQNQYGAQGLQVVGVAMDDSGKDEIAKFAKDMGMNYPVLIGKEAVGDAYGGVPALPESFFVGRDGKIVDKIVGLEGRSDIEDAIKKALNTQVTASAAAAGDTLIGPK